MMTNLFMDGEVLKLKNVESFTKTFDTAEIVGLEQNYRSTNIILGAAKRINRKQY